MSKLERRSSKRLERREGSAPYLPKQDSRTDAGGSTGLTKCAAATSSMGLLGLRVTVRHVCHRYGGNSHLVYAIVRRKKVFQQLELLTLPAGEPLAFPSCVATAPRQCA